MGYIDKHFTLSEEVCSMIRNRDKKRFPLERDFVTAAVLSYGEDRDLEEIKKDLKEFRISVEKTLANVGWK